MTKRPGMRVQPALSKSPATDKLVDVSKTPRAAYDGDRFYQERPSWRISLLQVIDPFGWHEIEGPKVLDIRKKLSDFESMTWSEILIQGKKFHHMVPVKQVCAEAQKHLQEIKQADIDQLVSLRLMSKERVWGILDQSTLKILWWDPNHLVCPSLKKHT